jgi:hypothetical protein
LQDALILPPVVKASLLLWVSCDPQLSEEEERFMARKRRRSPVLETAQQRLAGIKQINPEPNFGGDLTVGPLPPGLRASPEISALTTNIWLPSMTNKTPSTQRKKSCAIGTAAGYLPSRPNTAATAANTN